MIEQLRSAGDRLRAAWDNYYRLCSSLKNYDAQREASHVYGFPPEISRQLDIELAFISSYESKMPEIKVAISRTRNYSSGLAPINNLPPDVLTRIFHFVLTRPCSLDRDGYTRMRHFGRPEYLAQVCALWRKTTMTSHFLWHHIDLSSHVPWYDKLIARAKTHVARAGDAPIELHIAESMDANLKKAHRSCNDLYEFISRISSRVESLEFVVTGRFRGLHRSVLGRLLLNQHPTLTKLIIRSEGDHYDTFISAGDFDSGESDDEREDFALDLTKNQVKSGFAPLTALHLHGVFPLWTSTAYHGLVDLRLLSTNLLSHIKEAELITVLKSSPGLRILHFGLEIQEPTPDTEQITPVSLEVLQVVRIFPTNFEGTAPPSRVLRLLAPGSKPLRLSFDSGYEPEPVLFTELERFFARSRVVRFYTWGDLPPMNILLRHAPHLERVVVDNVRTQAEIELPSTWLQIDGLASLPRLRSLWILSSSLLVDELRLLVDCCPTGTLLYYCSVDRDTESMYPSLRQGELSATFPSVGTLDRDFDSGWDPTADWDVLD